MTSTNGDYADVPVSSLGCSECVENEAGEPVTPLLTPEQVAEKLAVPVSWIYRAAREGRLPHVRLGHYVRFDEADVEAWIVEQRASSANR